MGEWKRLAIEVLEGKELSNVEALSILNTPDEELLELLHASYIIRHRYFGNKVKLNKINNVKSGICPENCSYCAQSSISNAPVEKYTMLDKETIVEGAKQAYEMQVGTYCIVASGRGPSQRELETVTEAVKEIKERFNLTVCACLGILKPEQAIQLKEAGVDRYNHNINTSERHHLAITTTHTFDDVTDKIELTVLDK